MRHFIIAWVLAAVTACSSALGTKTLPGYQHLYSFAFQLSGNHQIQGPLGTRYGVAPLG